MTSESATIVKRLWNDCSVLRDDGLSVRRCCEMYLLIARNPGKAVEGRLVPQS